MGLNLTELIVELRRELELRATELVNPEYICLKARESQGVQGERKLNPVALILR